MRRNIKVSQEQGNKNNNKNNNSQTSRPRCSWPKRASRIKEKDNKAGEIFVPCFLVFFIDVFHERFL